VRHYRAEDGLGCVERMVSDHNPRHILSAVCQMLDSGLDLDPVDTTVLEGHRAGRINAEHRDFGILVKGCETVCDVASMPNGDSQRWKIL
jgi:hypothetical protein